MYIKRTKPPELVIQEMIDRLSPEDREAMEAIEMTTDEAEMIIKKANTIRREMARQFDAILGK